MWLLGKHLEPAVVDVLHCYVDQNDKLLLSKLAKKQVGMYLTGAMTTMVWSSMPTKTLNGCRKR